MAISRRSNPGPEIKAIAIALNMLPVEELAPGFDEDGNPIYPDCHPFPPECLPSNLPSGCGGPDSLIKKIFDTLQWWRDNGVDVPTNLLFHPDVMQCITSSPILYSIFMKMMEDLVGIPFPRNSTRGLLWMYRLLYELYRRCPAAREKVQQILERIRQLMNEPFGGQIPPIFGEPFPPPHLHPTKPGPGPNFGEPWAPFPKMPQPPGDGCPELPVLPDPPPDGITAGTSFNDPAFKI